MYHSRGKSMVAMITMATIIAKIMEKFALFKSVTIWLYEYDIHLVMNDVHHIEIYEYQGHVISIQI